MSLREARKPGETLLECLVRQRRHNHAEGSRKEFTDELLRFCQVASKLYGLGLIGVADVSPSLLEEPAAVDLTAMGEEAVTKAIKSEPIGAEDAACQPIGPQPGGGIVQ